VLQLRMHLVLLLRTLLWTLEGCCFHRQAFSAPSPFTQLCFLMGYFLAQWKSGLQVVWEKKTWDIHVDLLCTLLFLEADFNFSNKLFITHRLMTTAVTHATIPNKCFGSIKGHHTIPLSLAEVLVANIARQWCCPLALAGQLQEHAM